MADLWLSASARPLARVTHAFTASFMTDSQGPQSAAPSGVPPSFIIRLLATSFWVSFWSGAVCMTHVLNRCYYFSLYGTNAHNCQSHCFVVCAPAAYAVCS